MDPTNPVTPRKALSSWKALWEVWRKNQWKSFWTGSAEKSQNSPKLVLGCEKGSFCFQWQLIRLDDYLYRQPWEKVWEGGNRSWSNLSILEELQGIQEASELGKEYGSHLELTDQSKLEWKWLEWETTNRKKPRNSSLFRKLNAHERKVGVIQMRLRTSKTENPELQPQFHLYKVDRKSRIWVLGFS